MAYIKLSRFPQRAESPQTGWRSGKKLYIFPWLYFTRLWVICQALLYQVLGNFLASISLVSATKKQGIIWYMPKPGYPSPPHLRTQHHPCIIRQMRIWDENSEEHSEGLSEGIPEEHSEGDVSLLLRSTRADCLGDCLRQARSHPEWQMVLLGRNFLDFELFLLVSLFFFNYFSN